ncbi:MAG TPA: oligosaccharide flippase family protein [Candidatus Acidoferrum sp.]|jgi:O-antigen/teichoic acid export membrane protein|nr:oligosaccharide flippase family protein [Candidatus Acidoferrum sp.]
MADISTPELETAPPHAEPSALERSAIRILAYIPGLRGLGPSRRVMTAMRGGTWTMVGYGASQLLKLASALTLARMLAPQAFGLVALVTVFLSGLEMLSDLGIGMDVVQNARGDDPLFINTAFIIQTVRGVVLWVIATAFAYPFARFYHQPAVVSLLIVGALSVLLRGLTSGSIWGLTRHVELGRYNLLTTGSDFFGFIVSLTWAILSPTAWALVVGRVAGAFALVVASHWIAKDRVTTSWDPKAAKEILLFGSGIVLATGTYFLSGEAERLVVAKFVNLVELGCFALALSISTAAATGLQQIVLRVFFPMMSVSLREDRTSAVRHYKKAARVLCIVSASLAAGFIVGSHLFVKIVLGPKYAEAGWMLQLLGVRAALEVFTLLSVSMLFALGLSRYGAIGNLFKLTFMAVGLTVAFSHYGFHAALVVLTVAPLATYIPFLYGLRRHCREVLRTELASFAGFLTSVVLTVFVVVMFLHLRGFHR